MERMRSIRFKPTSRGVYGTFTCGMRRILAQLRIHNAPDGHCINNPLLTSLRNWTCRRQLYAVSEFALRPSEIQKVVVWLHHSLWKYIEGRLKVGDSRWGVPRWTSFLVADKLGSMGVGVIDSSPEPRWFPSGDWVLSLIDWDWRPRVDNEQPGVRPSSKPLG